MKYIPPAFQKTAFHCPHSNCGAFAKQTWRGPHWLVPLQTGGQGYASVQNLMLAVCEHCGQYSVWLNEKLLFPAIKATPSPHPEMPKAIVADYEEARALYQDSPRSSAALLRLAIQKLCVELGQPGKNLNADIGELVKQGLPMRVQQSLDIVRVVGNNQVHPGVLDVRDNLEMAMILFELVNIIVEDRIARPRQIDALYAKLPESARKQIEERDAKSQGQSNKM